MRDQLSEDIYFSCLRRNDNCNLSCRVLVSWRPHTLELHFELAKYWNQNGKSWRLDDVCLCVFAYCIDQTLSIFTNCTIYVYTYSCIKGKRECTYKFEETASIHRPVLGLRDVSINTFSSKQKIYNLSVYFTGVRNLLFLTQINVVVKWIW